MAKAGTIRVGIGGWTYPPWRGDFYPAGLPHKQELAFAAGRLTAIEINATFHGPQKPQSFTNWAAAVPDGFVFALKASKYVCGRKVLAEAGEGIERFVGGGLVELGDRLGPILWQMPAHRRFDPDDIAAFLALLPQSHAGTALRHAIQVRHASFACPEFVALARAAGVAIAFADAGTAPIFDVTADFAYLRLEAAQAEETAGYPADALDRWAADAQGWAAGAAPDRHALLGPAPPAAPRDTFVFCINGAKERAPFAATALIARLSEGG